MSGRAAGALGRLRRFLVAAVVLRATRGGSPSRSERDLPASPRAESVVAALLYGTGLAGLGFVAVYAFDDASTQLLGATGGLALGLLAAALVVAGSRVVPQEQLEEDRPRFARPDGGGEEEREHAEADVASAARTFEAGSEGVTRRRLLRRAGGVAGVGLGAAALTPIASLGPAVGNRLDASPWSDGVGIVEENGMPIRAADLEVGSYITAFAKGADKGDLASSLVVVRVKPEELDLPPERADWAPEGILAYSKICTHAQCAISLFRYPVFAERSPGPAVVCPCHYSTFDVLRGGERIFGPAVRPLPQLPLRIERGTLIAAGPFSGDVGASWSGVREDS